MGGHRSAVQYSDEMYCTACGRRWDVNDPEPPPCEAVDGADKPPYKAERPTRGWVPWSRRR